MKRITAVCIETSSMCNRKCATCIRNSTPDIGSVADWFVQNYLPTFTIEEIFRQCAQLNFPIVVWLSYYNEPLLDSRIVDLGKMAKEYGLTQLRLVTNGDLLTPELASKLDGVFDTINISIYENGRRRKRLRGEYLSSLFQKTRIIPITREHSVTHYNSSAVLTKATSCRLQLNKLIVNHRGEYLLCCEEMIPHFDFGKFPDVSISDYWWGKKHRTVMRDLIYNENRQLYPYCASCPRVKRIRKVKGESCETVGDYICTQ
jgi:hypothetical protein